MSQMIEQIVEYDNTTRGTLLDDYLAAEAQMRVLHDGAALRRAVDAILPQLPGGQITLLATSPQGIGIAAATAARRREPTAWQLLDVRLGVQEVIAGRAVIVEPVEPGDGWRSMIGRIVPGCTFVFPARNATDVLAA